MKIAIVIMTLNAGSGFKQLLDSIEMQDYPIHRKLIADSSSEDDTVILGRKYHYEILPIERHTFNHGDTRKKCAEYLDGIDIVIYLTQDVILFDTKSIYHLVEVFSDEKIAVSYGRQLPHIGASPMAAQARLFNYPDESKIKSYEDKEYLKIKAPFLSDSFAAYRVTALNKVGNFPHVIVSEDMYIGAKLLMAHYKIAYVAEACVYHSHDYTLLQELKRYFDVGVFQAREPWIRQEFGGAEGEGLKLVKDQLAYLYLHGGISSIPRAIFVNFIKLIGYRLGVYEKYLPRYIKKMLSGQSYFFS